MIKRLINRAVDHRFVEEASVRSREVQSLYEALRSNYEAATREIDEVFSEVVRLRVQLVAHIQPAVKRTPTSKKACR